MPASSGEEDPHEQTYRTKQEKSLRPFEHTSSGDKVAGNLNKKFHCHPYNEGIILDERTVNSETKQMVLDGQTIGRLNANHGPAAIIQRRKQVGITRVEYSGVSRGSCCSRANPSRCRSTLRPPAPLHPCSRPACICKNACPYSGISTMMFTLLGRRSKASC